MTHVNDSTITLQSAQFPNLQKIPPLSPPWNWSEILPSHPPSRTSNSSSMDGTNQRSKGCCQTFRINILKHPYSTANDRAAVLCSRLPSTREIPFDWRRFGLWIACSSLLQLHCLIRVSEVQAGVRGLEPGMPPEACVESFLLLLGAKSCSFPSIYERGMVQTLRMLRGQRFF